MIFLEETMKNTATEFTQNSVMSTILIATDWIRDRVSRKQKAGPRNCIRVDGIPDNDKRPGQVQKKKVKHFLEEKLDLGLEPVVERAHILGATTRHLFQN